MKKLFFFLCYTIITTANNQEIFLQAHELYKQHDYQKAFELYQSIDKKGCATWYNMGNCSYYLGNKERAYIYWQMAHVGACPSLRQAIMYNCNRINEHQDVVTTASLVSAITAWLGLVSSYASLFVWQIVVLCTWFLFWYMFATYRHYYKFNILIVSIVLMCSLLLSMRFFEVHRLQACITEPGIILFAGPNKEYHHVGSIDEIACVEIKRSEGQWCQICYKQLIGWVPKDRLELV